MVSDFSIHHRLLRMAELITLELGLLVGLLTQIQQDVAIMFSCLVEKEETSLKALFVTV